MDLSKIFTTEGFLRDQNQDGVVDSLQLSIKVEENLPFLGLIDFLARLGLETSELSLPIINKSVKENDWILQIQSTIDKQMFSICYLETSQRKMIIDGGNSEAINQLLRWMSANWPDTVQLSEEVIQLSWDNGEIRYTNFQGEEKSLSKLESNKIDSTLKGEYQNRENKNKPLTSLTQLWTTMGFFQGGRVDLNTQANIGFSISGNKHHLADIIKETAHMAARIGLASAGMKFPLTGETALEKELFFYIEEDETSTDASIKLLPVQDNQHNGIKISGDFNSLIEAIHYLATEKPVEEGGHFGSWEKEYLDNKQSKLYFPEWLKKVWNDSGERQDFIKWWDQTCIDLEKRDAEQVNQLEIEGFISEPYFIREEIQTMIRKQIQTIFPNVKSKIQIHSAYKPGFHWIEEKVSKDILNIKQPINRVKIFFQKEIHANGLELEIRWLQELYPIDQWLEKETGLSIQNIEFIMKDDLPTTYLFEAYNDQILIESWELTVPVHPMLYLKDKYSYPTTGQAKLIINSEQTYQKHISTDRERFWREYTSDFLPRIKKLILSQMKEQKVREPLFHSLEVHVWMSEEEKKLNIDEERISSLEALHEDIYFFTLDYFAKLGEDIQGEPWNSPGAIHPFIHIRQQENPKAEIILRKYQSAEKIQLSTKELKFDLKNPDRLIATIEQTKNRQIKCKEVSSEIHQTSKEIVKSQDPRIHIWNVKDSFDKRPISVIEVTSPQVSQYRSTHKLSLFKPTILIEAGHHANEVSSMPAIKELINDILNNHPDWLDNINLVIIPTANPDGLALQQKLTAEHPEWKHHAARFNSVGLEYAHHRFKETPFGEVEVVPNLFYRWLPDVVIDDHGIPSHEWTQPFAGYNSPPRFPVSYWIPISLIYGIAKQLDDNRYPGHNKALKQVVHSINMAFKNNQSLQKKNKLYQERYKRYGYQWLPNVFPYEKHQGDLIFYYSPITPDRSSTSLISRFPEWVTLDIISEAADETVYGEALRDCIDVHKIFDKAIIQWVSQHPQTINRSNDNGWIKWKRKRPL